MKALLLSVISLLLFTLPAQAASSLVVTTWGQTSTFTTAGGDNFGVTTTDGRFIRFIINRPDGSGFWGILLGMPQGAPLANGVYTNVGEADPVTWGPGFSIAGTNPTTGLYEGANTLGGQFTLSDLHLDAGGNVDAATLQFDVLANGRQSGELRYNTTTSVPEPGGALSLMIIGVAGIVVWRQKSK